MPQIKSLHNNDSTIHIWNITESEEELHTLLSSDIPEFIDNHKNEWHRKQLLAKIIMQKELALNELIFKNKHGKPFLKNGQFISISHADNFVGIALSNHEIGIDIEKTSDKLTRIISKFLHKNEKNLPQQTNIHQLLQIWTAKESIYKLMGIPGLRFREDIEITQLDDYSGEALVKNVTKITLFFEKLSKNVLICCASL